MKKNVYFGECVSKLKVSVLASGSVIQLNIFLSLILCTQVNSTQMTCYFSPQIHCQMKHQGRVFFKVLSSQSFFKGKRLWVLKSNMADKMSYCLYMYFPATTARFVKKTVPIRMFFKLTLSQKSFYVFRKDRQCKFIFLLSPSLDLINIISVWALEAMEVAGETLQRSQHTSPAAGSYLQPCQGGM